MVGLVQLHRVESLEERRSLWRQSMASLGAAASEQTPAPLEGLQPEAIVASARVALMDGFVDELDFLSPPAAAVALYELAASLPPGFEKREIGRRISHRLYDGNAATFIALATALALGARRGLSGPRLRARVALALDLPIGLGMNADALALALISRRELVREWLTTPSTGSLASRRLAARLLERAAREAAHRAARGDDASIRVFLSERISQAWQRLISDREPLVWRHVATARGLLSAAMPGFANQIERDLRPTLTPTEWRRAATSLAARIAVEPAAAMKRARDVLEGELMSRDPGIAAGMVFGLTRAAETEPKASQELLELCVKLGGIEAAEALVDVRREQVGNDFGDGAAALAREFLNQRRELAGDEDDGRTELIESLIAELSNRSERKTIALRDQIVEAQRAFVENGPAHAVKMALPIVDEALRAVERLKANKEETAEKRQQSFRDLRELDVALLETSAVNDLLVLAMRNDDPVATPIASVQANLLDWLLEQEREPLTLAGAVPHITLRMRRFRTLLHLVDADAVADDERIGILRERRLRTLRTLLFRASHDAQSPLRRTVCATLARVMDALIREEICELSDVLIGAVSEIKNVNDLSILAEATTVPDLELALRTYLNIAKTLQAQSTTSGVTALLDHARSIPSASTPRVEALRGALIRLALNLEAIAHARGFSDLPSSSDGKLIQPVENSALLVAQLVLGARRRVGMIAVDKPPLCGVRLKRVDVALERKENGETATLEAVLGDVDSTLHEELPHAYADVVMNTLSHLREMPSIAPPRKSSSFRPPPRTAEAPLPPWLPPSRTLSGFYVLRCIGSGAVGTVFVAKRSDERHDSGAETFALKVPEYNGAAARSLSEVEFLRLFREEAGALLSIPANRHLAHLVTFDGGAKPKPILVMEFVQGPSLERLLQQESVQLESAFRYLDGVAEGLEAMHAGGIGHLDVKPSNVIIRRSNAGKPTEEAVLVDFGLAGRKLRPGCATGSYGAPEVWTNLYPGQEFHPLPADVYALACVAFESVTGRTLFEGINETALVHSHLLHDGNPPGLSRLPNDPASQQFVATLKTGLRQDPRNRATISEFRKRLAESARAFADTEWPLPLTDL